MKSGCSASSFAGGQSAFAVAISASHQWSRPCFIATVWPVRLTTTIASTEGVPAQASSTAALSAKGVPRR